MILGFYDFLKNIIQFKQEILAIIASPINKYTGNNF